MKNRSADTDTHIKLSALLHEMTLDEKIGQMCQSSVTADNIDEVCEKIEKSELGSCILTGTALAGASDETVDNRCVQRIIEASKKSRLKIPVILGRDIIHGSRTNFPIPLAQAASFDTELAEEGAYRMSREAAKEGVGWTFSPMLDIARDPRWGRVIEGFGEDPYLTSRFAEAFVKGTQKSGMAACAKHYIGYSAAEGGVDYANSEITDYTLRNIYLPPFRAAVDAGVATVMNSFGNIGGMPCVANKYLFRDILKGELGFDGFVISDWGSVEWQIKAGTASDKAECAENSIKAGIDMEMVTECYRENLKALVESGRVDISLIDEAVLRILKIKEKFCREPMLDHEGLFSAEDYDFAEKAALNCAILLKNSGGILPLKPRKFVLSGPFAVEKRGLQGSWCAGTERGAVTLFEALCDLYGQETVCLDTNMHKVSSKSFDCDTVVLALGEDFSDTGERQSMSRVELDSTQVELAKRAKMLGKKVVAVVFGGRPLVLSELEMYADAVLYSWHGGVMAARAAAKILHGDFNPCAKTPITFLRSTTQLPMYYNCMPLPIRVDGEYSYYSEPTCVIYNDERSTPLYPFGYGLSYTDFRISKPVCDKTEVSLDELKNGGGITVTVEVANTGGTDGAEICQLYIRDEVSLKARPIKELKGFKKVYLKQGESEKVSFQLGLRELGYYPERELSLEKGDIGIFVGNSCMTDNACRIKIT